MSKKDNNLEWYQKHPLISDTTFIVLPALLISSTWFIITGNTIVSIIQGFLIAIGVVFSILYMEKKYDKKVFRYINTKDFI